MKQLLMMAFLLTASAAQATDPVAEGMLIAESSILVRGMMESFGSQGVARHYTIALIVYIVRSSGRSEVASG